MMYKKKITGDKETDRQQTTLQYSLESFFYVYCKLNEVRHLFV